MDETTIKQPDDANTGGLGLLLESGGLLLNENATASSTDEMRGDQNG
jgi:hypothetical protein